MKSIRIELLGEVSNMRDVFEILATTLERKRVQEIIWSRQRLLYNNKMYSIVIGCERTALIQLIHDIVH
jgi:hypothetical protein